MYGLTKKAGSQLILFVYVCRSISDNCVLILQERLHINAVTANFYTCSTGMKSTVLHTIIKRLLPRRINNAGVGVCA